MRLHAYYYGFNPTGVQCIDRILSSVACAGKASHHTEGWCDEFEWSSENQVGKSCAEWIQNSANQASKEISAKNEALSQSLSFLIELRDVMGETYALTPNHCLQELIDKLEGLTLEGGE